MRGRDFFNKLSAWLALLAVAMLFVAPVISKSLMHHAGCQVPGTMMSMTMPGMHHEMMPASSCEPPSSAAHHFLSDGSGQSLMEDIACGYCQLLIHLPFVQFALAVLVWLILRLSQPLRFAPLRCPVIFRPWHPQSARAPPVCCVIHF